MAAHLLEQLEPALRQDLELDQPWNCYLALRLLELLRLEQVPNSFLPQLQVAVYQVQLQLKRYRLVLVSLPVPVCPVEQRWLFQ